jgi:hypothetical protein
LIPARSLTVRCATSFHDRILKEGILFEKT